MRWLHSAARQRNLILILYLLLGTLYSIAIPIFEISDELSHYPMVEYIARTWRLPIQPLEPQDEVGPWRQEGSQPPLYYGLAAVLTQWIDTSDFAEIRQTNPQAQAGAPRPDRQNPNLVMHDPTREAFPWQRTVLAVHLARWLSVWFGVWSVYLTWQIVHRLYPGPILLATVVAAVHAFTPQFLFISASVNNDALVTSLASATLLQIIVIVQQQRPASLWQGSLLGLTLGAAILSKEGALGLIPLVLAATAWVAWDNAGRPKRPDRSRLQPLVVQTAAWGIPMALVAGWWYWRNYRLYDDWLGLNAFLNAVGTRTFSPELRDLWGERFSFLAAYWGNFGGLNVLMPDWIYFALNCLAGSAGLGLLLALIKKIASALSDGARLVPWRWSRQTVARCLAWIWPLIVFTSVLRWTRMTPASQGRLLFLAISMVALGLVLGVLAWVPNSATKIRRYVAVGLAATFFCLGSIALPAWILPAYHLPPSLKPAEVAAISNPLNIVFGENLELLGYDLSTQTIQPGAPVALTLYWRALHPTSTDQLIFIHLLGDGGRIIAQYDAYPQRGLTSTKQLTPGAMWADQYLLSPPIFARAPDTLHLAVGVYEPGSGTRLLTRQTDTPDHARFGSIALQERTETPLPLQFGRGMLLKNYALDKATAARDESLTLRLRWQALARMPEDYTVSVQLINNQLQKAAQSDSWPLQGQAPTSSWQAGQTIDDEIVLNITPETQPGLYNLQLAVYALDAEGHFVHQPIRWQPGQAPVATLTLTQVRIFD